MNIEYKINTAKTEEVFRHFKLCSEDFVSYLDTVDLREYAEKINRYADSFEAWYNNELVGFLAVYLNDLENNRGYITNVSILKKYNNMGIASCLVNKASIYSRNLGFEILELEVNYNNTSAIRLYHKHNFNIASYRENSQIMRKVVGTTDEK